MSDNVAWEGQYIGRTGNIVQINLCKDKMRKTAFILL